MSFAGERRWLIGTLSTGFETPNSGKSWAPVLFGRAVNKIRGVSRAKGKQRAFAVGVDVNRPGL